MTAYSDSTKIAAYLGVTLTAGQITQAGVVAQAASDWIDRYVGRSWQATSPVTDEVHGVFGDTIYLDRRPVASVTSVKTRQHYPNAGITTLSPSQYELLDAANGVLLISGWAGAGFNVLVSYTHTQTTAPSDVSLAATMIAASWLGSSMAGLPSGIEQIALGQSDIDVKFSAGHGDVPMAALSILAGYRTWVIA